MGKDGQSSYSLGDGKTVSSTRYLLPNDLPAAIKYLNDGELNELEAAVAAEHVEQSKDAAATVSLRPGQLNAVRAALEAGLTKARIAREFGIPQSEVRRQWRV